MRQPSFWFGLQRILNCRRCTARSQWRCGTIGARQPRPQRMKGKTFPMEVHFVHKNRESGALGVLGVFLTAGATNETFASLAAACPAEAGGQSSLKDVDPKGLLPASLGY
jgi:carbonic anhydrase